MPAARPRRSPAGARAAGRGPEEGDHPAGEETDRDRTEGEGRVRAPRLDRSQLAALRRKLQEKYH
jgi:hypothetical protein